MVWRKIQAYAQSRPDEIAIIGETKRYSWLQLTQQVEQIASQLAPFRNKVVALYEDNSPAWIVIDLACRISDVILLPLPRFFSDQQISHAIKQAGASVVIYDDQRIIPIIDEFLIDDKGEDIAGLTSKTLTTPHSSLPENTAKITFTSGSTGQPKGVCLSNEQQIKVAEALLNAIEQGATKHLSILPFSTLLENIGGIYAPLLSGGSIIALPQHSLGFNGSSGFDLTKLTATIAEYQPQSMILLPELMQALLLAIKQGWQPPESLRFIALGGSKVSMSLLQQAQDVGLPVYEGYGLSECGSVVSLNTPKNTLAGSIGNVLEHISVIIEEGEIIVTGNTFLGYVNDKNSWLQTKVYTGDLGYFDDHNYLHINGRKKNLIISSFGRNINPEWIESELLASGLLRYAVLFGDAKPYCIAIVQKRDENTADDLIQSEIDRINQQLPNYAQVKKWAHVTMDNGLITSNGRPVREKIYQTYQQIIEKLYRGLKMAFFERLKTETEAAQADLYTAPLIKKGLTGDISLEEYIEFLTQAYHHVKHTTPLLMAVGARLPEEKEWLRNAVAEYIEEELGHQEWILNDIAACGADKEAVRRSQPAPETELMVAYAYDTVNRINPLGFFGMVHVLEGTSIATADAAAAGVQKALGLPNEAFSYLRSHGALDIEHVKFFEGLMNQITDKDEQDLIIHCAKMVYRLYGDVFRSVTAH
jgi:long-subunit acyl-CoA synthetase (AMP-forming)